MLVSGFPGRGYLSAASPMLVALCTCEWRLLLHDEKMIKYTIDISKCNSGINNYPCEWRLSLTGIVNNTDATYHQICSMQYRNRNAIMLVVVF